MFAGLNTLVKTIAVYSYKIYQHSANVRGIATRIANYLGLPEDQTALIANAGLLHDIGKTQIDIKILNKTKKLTADEWAIIKRHPELGIGILSSYPWAEPFFPLVNYHHERWDGNGYFGISGQDIPLGARILAVADAFDAMTSSRPYQNSKSWEQSLKELERCSGTQFDPYLVEKVIQSSDKIFKK